MLVAIAFVVLGMSIAVFFSQELATGYKKIMALPGAVLCLPLLVSSIFVEIYDMEGLVVLRTCQMGLHYIVHSLYTSLSLDPELWVCRAMGLFLISSIPSWIVFGFRFKRVIKPSQSVNYVVNSYPWVLTSLLILL